MSGPGKEAANTVSPAVDRLAALREASQQLLRIQEPAELAANIIAILERLLAYDYLAVMRIDPITERLLPFAVSDQGKGHHFREHDMAYIESAGIKVGDGVVGWVARHGTSVLIDDVREDPRYLSLRENIGSELCVPLIADGEVIGVINAETGSTGAFDVEDRLVLETIAAQIAIAIENVSLLTEARRARRDLLVAKYAGDVAHDLGNLLAAISLDAAVLSDDPGAAAGCREQLARIVTAAQQGVRLAHSMLHAGREEASHGSGAVAAEMNSVVSSNELLIRAVVGGSIRASIDLASVELPLSVSTAELEQVMLNLVFNAKQSMRDGGEIRIETRLENRSGSGGGTAVLQVSDTGTGMSEQVREQAFKPYFTTRDEGSGLGLATVARVVESAGGGAEIESAPGRGTCVKVSFPLRKAALSA